ncbi:hypothetical protein Ct9H90mP29_01600 [bacterium]|nr:MAG: hypothetical protein Ct9H90mP29_01600 [bacterium]
MINLMAQRIKWYPSGLKSAQGNYVKNKEEGIHTFGTLMGIKSLKQILKMEKSLDHE